MQLQGRTWGLRGSHSHRAPTDRASADGDIVSETPAGSQPPPPPRDSSTQKTSTMTGFMVLSAACGSLAHPGTVPHTAGEQGMLFWGSKSYSYRAGGLSQAHFSHQSRRGLCLCVVRQTASCQPHDCQSAWSCVSAGSHRITSCLVPKKSMDFYEQRSQPLLKVDENISHKLACSCKESFPLCLS